MNFGIFAQSCLPFHAGSLSERALGGTETGIINMASALRELGHQVAVFSDSEKPPPSDPLYLRYQALPLIGKLDVFIAVREWMPLFMNIDCKKRMFWTGDSYDQPGNAGIGDKRVSERIDVLLAVSAWQAKTLCDKSGFPIEKSWVIRNGVNLKLFAGSEKRLRKRLIYSSTPYRGLKLLPAIFSEIKRRHPDAELCVFSGYDVYMSRSGYYDPALREFENLRKELEAVPGITVHGNVTQEVLAREFMKSAVLAYPNTFEETSCITAMEAQAAGCVVVTSNLGALPETVGDAGILVGGTPGTTEYMRNFIEALDLILSDDEAFLKLSRRGAEHAQRSLSWGVVAKRFENFVQQLVA